MSAVRARLDGGRWHFQHGPIDLIIAAEGAREEVDAACENGWRCFQGTLADLVAELPRLRSSVDLAGPVEGAVARRMLRACWPYRDRFITPMAAVAGAVADEVMAALLQGGAVRKAYVNNGGDIALHLTPGTSFRIGRAAVPDGHGHAPGLDGRFQIDTTLPVRGIATSGWRGRSWSLGVADAVTVLAHDAAAADAAATMIANEVNAEHPAIVRRPAREVDDNTDLGSLLVTVDVGELPQSVMDAALDRGAVHAQTLLGAGLIWGAVLSLGGAHRVAGGSAALLH